MSRTPATPTRHRLLGALRAAAAAGLAAVVLGLGAGPAGASTTVSVPEDLRPRLELVCARVDTLTTTVADRLARLNGTADTRGSRAWLQARIDKASAAGRTELVTLLTERLQVRTSLVNVLDQRQALLADLDARCAQVGL